MVKKASTTGFAAARLKYLKSAIECDIENGKYHGAVILVARHGKIGLHEAIGYARFSDRQPMRKDKVFNLFSITKALTNVLVFRAIERGDLALTTKVSSIIPEFSGGTREKITLEHLLTHTTGLPPLFAPVPGMCIDRLDEVIAAICAHMHTTGAPGLIAASGSTTEGNSSYSTAIASAALCAANREVATTAATVSPT